MYTFREIETKREQREKEKKIQIRTTKKKMRKKKYVADHITASATAIH